MRILPVLALSFPIAACVEAPKPPAPAPPVVARAVPRPVPAPLAADWADWALTRGTWSYQRDARGSRALFGQAGADARIVLRCDLAQRQVYLSRDGVAAGAITVRTTSATRALTARPTGGQPAYVAAALAPNDPLLDAIAFSRGRFTVEQAGTPPLVAPNWAEIARVIEDCRR